MSAFVLHGSRTSTNTMRVRLTLAEGNITDYEFVLLNLLKGEQKYEEHRKRHPWGKVPTITFPDSFTLHESRAICKYLTTKYSIPLLPPSSDAEATARFDEAQSVEMFYFADPVQKLTFEKFIKKLMTGGAPDEKVVADSLQALETYFDTAEILLQKRSYMAGESYTLIDLYYIPLMLRLFAVGHGDLITSHKTVNAWYERCVSRPAIQRVLAADKEAAAAVDENK
ncbi:putative glutathione-S-transferase theta, GST [Paraphoma chrysanthemicola]|nr:putative glutathione-S-transferase theta, GST [Paraphoma chrysanthemicola]